MGEAFAYGEKICFSLLGIVDRIHNITDKAYPPVAFCRKIRLGIWVAGSVIFQEILTDPLIAEDTFYMGFTDGEFHFEGLTPVFFTGMDNDIVAGFYHGEFQLEEEGGVVGEFLEKSTGRDPEQRDIRQAGGDAKGDG